MKPIWKWILGIFVTLLIAVLFASWYLGNNWKPMIESKLKAAVYDATDSLYTLTYDDLELNIALGNITFKNVELKPDSSIYRALVEAKKAPDNRFHIKLSALKVRRFSLLDITTSRKLEIKRIDFEDPYIHLLNEYHSYNDTIANRSGKSVYDSFKDILQSVNVKDITIDNIDFLYSKVDSNVNSSVNLKKVNIKVHDVLVNATSIEDSSRLYYTKMVDIELPAFEYKLGNGFYKVSFGDMKINTQERNVLLTDLVYEPVMSKREFYRQKKENITMAVLKFDTVRFEQFNFKQLIDDKQTIAKKVQVKNGIISLSTDKSLPKKIVSKIGDSPHQQLMKAQNLIKIDTIVVDNVDVGYYEFSGKYYREGSITFNDITGTLTNVTNDSLILKNEPILRADLHSKIMNRGKLHTQFGFDMLSEKGEHTYKGTLDGMNAREFNRILTPLLNVEIASGNIRSIRFDMRGTDQRNWGDFRFNYDNLKVSLLNEPGSEKKRSSRGVLSFLLNTILINDSNPDANEIYHVGKVNYRRVPEHTFFKTLWQSLLDGVKQTAGISPEREAKLIGRAEAAQEKVKETKESVKGAKSFIKGLFHKKE